MRPDTPLCESLRPRRRRLQLLGRCSSLCPARLPLCPLGPGVHWAPDRRQSGHTGRAGPRPQRPGPPLSAGPSHRVPPRPRRASPFLGCRTRGPQEQAPRPGRDRTLVPSRAVRQGRQGARSPRRLRVTRIGDHFSSRWFLSSPLHTLFPGLSWHWLFPFILIPSSVLGLP